MEITLAMAAVNDISSYLDSLAKWRGDNIFSLELILSLMEKLGDPQDRVPCAHVAGTNGKGSVTISLASVMAQSGRKVGAYISPHLSHPRERIIIDGDPITEEFFAECINSVRAASESLGVRPSYFEALTAAAFISFHEAGVEFAAIEVGLGGRLDATNVIKSPIVSVITSIDLDHVAILGGTKVEIANEKGGIIKESCPVVLGRMDPDPREAIEKIAAAKRCPVYRLGIDFNNKYNMLTKLGILQAADGNGIRFSPALRGRHQVDNASVAIQAGILCGASNEEASLGVSEVFWPGRLEEGELFGRKILIDAAHNPAGVKSLANYLRESAIKDIDLVFGALATKDWGDMVSLLAPFVKRAIILEPASGSAACAEQVRARFGAEGVGDVSVCPDSATVLQCIRDSSQVSRVVITGSIYMIGGVRDAILSLPAKFQTFADRRFWRSGGNFAATQSG